MKLSIVIISMDFDHSCLVNCFIDEDNSEELLGQILLYMLKELGMLDPALTDAINSSQANFDTAHIRTLCVHHWKVSTANVCNLEAVPLKKTHPGTFEWCGTEDTRAPKWLWDSDPRSSRTVEATEERLQDGYIAISYTWGRWKDGSQAQDGTPWKLPRIDPMVFAAMLTQLKKLMRDISWNRYFWVDVLCIDQENKEKRNEEVSKQASIFGKAKGVLAYLWSLDFDDDLSQAIANLGDFILWSLCCPPHEQLRFSELCHESAPSLDGDTKLPDVFRDKVDAKLRLDPWFSSLWALQEMVLCPSALWITKNGTMCTVNGINITTRFVARATQLLSWAYDYRALVWDRIASSYPRGQHLASFGAEVAALVEHTLYRTPEQMHLWEQSATAEQQSLMTRRFRGIEARYIESGGVELNDHTLPEELDAIYKRELNLRRQSRRWIEWAKGEAGLTLSISASRGAILVAGANRHSTKRRGEALLAALKIEYDHRYVTKDNLGPGALPIPLLQKLIELEGSKLLYASQAAKQVTEERNPESPLHNPWNSGPPETEECSLLLSSVLPTTANFFNPGGLDLARYRPIDTNHWTILPDGSLHIPAGTAMHRPRCNDMGVVSIFGNGYPMYFQRFRACCLKEIIRDKGCVLMYLGEKCRVKFLPLFQADPSSSATLFDPANSAPQLTRLPLPTIVGLILVGRGSLKRSKSMTHWHKYGLYWASEYHPKPLEWNNGIKIRAIQVETRELCRRASM